MPPIVDLDRAQITRDGDGTLRVDDPDCPLIVEVQVGRARAHACLTRVTVTLRHPHGRITAAALARLPLDQLLYLGAQQAGSHPNEAYYRTLAIPKPPGSRRWPDEHWTRVLAVYLWAQQTGRPGGGSAAVAEFWGVTVDPTVHRWMRYIREHSG